MIPNRAAVAVVALVLGVAVACSSTPAPGPEAQTSGSSTSASATSAPSATQPGDTAPDAVPPSAIKPGREGRLGDALETLAFDQGEDEVAVRVTEVIDPADSMVISDGLKVESFRFVVLRTQFVNQGTRPYPVPGNLFSLNDGDDRRKARITLTPTRDCDSYPPGSVPAGASVSACVVFSVENGTPVTAVHWSPPRARDDLTLTWKLDP